MEHDAGIDVALEQSSVCVVDGTGRIVREAKIASEPEAMIAWFAGLGFCLAPVGLEAGPLSQWLHAGLSPSDPIRWRPPYPTGADPGPKRDPGDRIEAPTRGLTTDGPLQNSNSRVGWHRAGSLPCRAHREKIALVH
jgi:hypothetical protein